MKKTFIALTAAVCIFALSACGNGNSSDKSEVVVQTKAGNVTKDELYNALKDRYGDQVLQELVYGKVLSKDYKVSDKEINARLQELKNQLGAQFPQAMQQAGFKTEAQFKKTLKVAILQEKSALKDVKVTDKELKDYYDTLKPEIKVRHILVADEKTANDIETKLKNKTATFEDLAKKESTDTGSAAKGGDLGWLTTAQMDQMVPEFKDAAYKLKVGVISAPVKSQYGYHIIEVTDKKELKAFKDMKASLVDTVKRTKLDSSKIDAAVQKVMDKADINVKDKDFKGLFDKKTAATK